MSRIGKLPVPVPGNAQVAVADGRVGVKGPKGSLEVSLPEGIRAELEGGELSLKRADDSRDQRSLHGLTRALVANAVHGVTEGFAKSLEIRGVGYRAEVKGKNLQLALGFSHPVIYPIPEGIEISVERNTQLRVSGCDRQQVGQVAAEIRSLRKPDPYKGKGIRYADELVRTKAGKSGVK